METKREQERDLCSQKVTEPSKQIEKCFLILEGCAALLSSDIRDPVAGNNRAKCCVIVGVAPAMFHYLSS